MIEQLRDVCLHVLHSHDGSRLSMLALWHGTPKDRKAIIKSFKGHVVKICSEKQGYMVRRPCRVQNCMTVKFFVQAFKKIPSVKRAF